MRILLVMLDPDVVFSGGEGMGLQRQVTLTRFGFKYDKLAPSSRNESGSSRGQGCEEEHIGKVVLVATSEICRRVRLQI